MAETGASESSSPETDQDFDPSAEMLVHDYDDEHTLEEEEALSGESCCNELDDLEKEGDMPLEELLAMYGYGGGETGGTSVPGRPVSEQQDTRSSSEEEILSNQDLTLDKDEIARDLLKNSDDDDDKETTAHELLTNVSNSQTVRLLRSQSQLGSEDDESESEDVDYSPAEPIDEWKKTIQVGSDYQAIVPEGLCQYGDAPAYENEDRLLWDPTKLDDSTVEKYLHDVHQQNMQNATGANAIPTGAHISDDEQALYMLLQCGHNMEEALRRRKMQAVPLTDPMSLWSEEECRNFENGLRTYGKDFYLIQQNKVKTRSVGELVHFYYLWKKTERHDVFANKTRLEKRKYALHPGVTDYMDRFLDDQESPVPPPSRERSASPVTSLIYGDPKRNQLKPPTESGDSAHSPNCTKSSPKLSEVNSASPTIVTVNNDLKRGHSAPSSPSQIKTVSKSAVNGGSDDFEPVSKKLKPDTDGSLYERQESYSDINYKDAVSSSSSISTTNNLSSGSSSSHSKVGSIVSSMNSDSLRTLPPVPSESVVQ